MAGHDADRTYHATQNNMNLTSSNGDAPLEKDFSRGEHNEDYHLDSSLDPGTALQKIRTTGSLSISPELFEKIYLSPQNRVAGDLRKTVGNPTPLALAGFLLSLSPLACDLMGWRGASKSNASVGIGPFYFFGGLLMILGAIGEFIVGNTFPFVVFGTFGAFWLSFAATLQPFYGAWSAYSPDPVTDPAAGLSSVEFSSGFAFFLLCMGLLCFVFLICSLRTNICFFGIFLFLVIAFGCLAGAYWNLAKAVPNIKVATNATVAAGACCFVVDALGWWIFMAILLAALDFPFQLPVGDLSHLIKGGSERAKREEGMGTEGV